MLIAATVSPPPAIENAPDTAIASPNAFVPLANASNSNTPIGPFQTIVPARETMSFSAETDCGPRSRIKSSEAMSRVALTMGAALAANSFAQTASMGMGTLPGKCASIDSASPTSSGSASDLPIFPPAARMNVLAMPPPTISVSTFASNARSTVSFVDTFAPPTIATSGRFGWSSALPRASSSAAINGPAHATGAYFAMPCVVASARCAVPNASFT